MPTPTIIRPHGRLDAARSPALEQELRQHLAQGHNNLIVDMGATSYISSNGLRVLLAIHKAAQQNEGRLVLCSLSARLMEIFEMVGFDKVFEIYDERAAAEQSFQK